MPHPNERQPSRWLDDPDSYPLIHNDESGSDQEPDYEDLIEQGFTVLPRRWRRL